MASFSAWDYVVFVIMLLISAGIGIYYRFTGGKQKTTAVSVVIIQKKSFYWIDKQNGFAEHK